MDQLLEYWLPIAIIAGTFIGAILAPLRGYFKKPQSGQSSTLHGAVMMDSTIGREISDTLKCLVLVVEKIELHMKETADSEAEDRKIKAAVEAERVKWERKQQGK